MTKLIAVNEIRCRSGIDQGGDMTVLTGEAVNWQNETMGHRHRITLAVTGQSFSGKEVLYVLVGHRSSMTEIGISAAVFYSCMG